MKPDYAKEMKWIKKRVKITSKTTIASSDYDRSKEMESVEYFKYLGSLTTNDARYESERKSRSGGKKKKINKNKTVFTSRIDLNVGKKLVKF